MPTFLSPLLKGTAKAFQLKNERTGSIIVSSLSTAFDSQSRRTGLLGRNAFAEGHGLIIAPTNAIHTFFMRFDIDIAFVARDGRIVKTRTALRPWRLAIAPRAYAVVELPSGTLDRTGTLRGDRLTVVSP